MRTQTTNYRYIAYMLFVAAFMFTACDSPMSTNDFETGQNNLDYVDSSFDMNNNSDELIPGQYIVLFKEGTNNVSQRANQMARGANAKVNQVYDSAVKGFSLTLPPQASPRAVEALKNNPNVAHIEQDRMIRNKPNVAHTDARRRAILHNTDFSTNSWGLDRVDQRYLPLDQSYKHEGDGSGVTVYVVDTGINFNHEDFEGRASFGFDVFGEDGSDYNGHGTHVAGTVGGKTWGVAKGVNLVSVRVLDESSSGTVSGVIAGIEWITANANGPSIANMSLGSGRSTAMDNAVRNSISAGITYITSAGNSNYDACFYSPARVSEVITVGATTNNDSKASYSNFGNCVDVFAPGTGIVSTWNSSTVATATLNGTSMSSPHVAGVAALLLQRVPSRTPADLFELIMNNSTKNIVQNSNSKNNHLIYSYDHIYVDNSDDGYNTQNDSDDSNDQNGSSGNNEPVINSFTVNTSSNGPWNNATVSWNVSASGGNLSNVTSELLSGTSVVDTSSTNLSSNSASGEHSLRDRGTITSVRITVTSQDGTSVTQTKTI